MKNAQEINMSGVGRMEVIRNGKTVYDSGEVKNLVGNSGFEPSTGTGLLAYNTTSLQFYTGSGAVSNYTDMDGTYSQTGTTLTRVSGSGVFSSGDVGKEVKYGTNQRCHITVFTNTTTVTVSKSQTVAATTLRRYETLFSYAAGGQSAYSTCTATVDLTAGVLVSTHVVNFAASGSSYVCTHFTCSNYSRIILPVAVTINVGDQIRLTYIYTERMGTRDAYTVPISSIVSGWPYLYGVSTISGNGTSTVTVTTSEAHNFAVGDAITISGAIPARKAVSTASSTSTTWTVNATSHGFSAGDTVTHEGFSVGGYNGNFTVASVVNANSYTVTNASNPGSSTGGTTRYATPGTYFNGNWTVATVPNSTSLTIASTVAGPPVDATATKISGKDECTVNMHGTPWQLLPSSASEYGACILEANAISPPAKTSTVLPTITAASSSGNMSPTVSGGYATDWLFTRTPGTGSNWGTGSSGLRVKQVYRAMRTGGNNLMEGYLITLTTPQEKKNAYGFKYPALRRQYTRDLP